ncbi:MAG: VPS10 domain-containing protein [Trueperaceae bacterium]
MRRILRGVLWVVLICVMVSCADTQNATDTQNTTEVDVAGSSVPKDPKTLDTVIKAKISASNQINLQVPAKQGKEVKLGWSNVAIGGSGYITGLYIHPKVKDLMYAKIDIGGVFRWDAPTESWISLMDFLPVEQWNDYGTEGVALDPNHPTTLYVATGNYDQEWADEGKIYRSNDQGRTWTKISPDGWGVKMGGGQYQRGMGERLAVSPSNSKVILFGSRRNGLLRSEDGGSTWQTQTFEGLNANLGIQSILFDPRQKGLVYASFKDLGIYRSTDDGKTWAEIPGGPTSGMRMTLNSKKGELWVSFDVFPNTADGGVAKLSSDDTWQVFYPAGEPVGAYGAIAVDPFDDNHILVAPTETYVQGSTYRSRDGGATWSKVEWNYNSTVPYVIGQKYGYDGWFQGEQAAYVFDPHRKNTFWMTNWFFTSRSTDIQNEKPKLTNLVYNQETTVNLALATNAKGELFAGTADVGGFYHDRGLATYPSNQFPELEGQKPTDEGETYAWNDSPGIVAFEGNRDVIFRTGNIRNWFPNGVAKSSDGGKTWKLLHEWDVVSDNGYEGKPLRIAVSATDENNIVVTRYNAATQYSKDGGATWKDAVGTGVTPNNGFYWGQPLISDGVKANTFYYYDDVAETVARSDDGGATFNVVATGIKNDSAGDRHGYLEATPGKAGDLWLALEDAGLYHSIDAGVTWTKLENVTQAWNFALGKAALPELSQTLFVYGKIDDKKGIWMSTDMGRSWYNLQHPKLEVGALPNNMEASRTEFGRLYIGTVGRGVLTFTMGFESK